MVDLWVSKISGGKFLGVRINFMGLDWTLHSYLIAVRQFRPNPRLMNRGGDVLNVYLNDIYKEFGIDPSKHIISFVTDAGSDVKRLCTSLVERPAQSDLARLAGEHPLWEHCLCHSLNLALVMGFGTCIDKKKSKNPEATEVFDKLMRTLETANKSADVKNYLQDLVFESVGVRVKLRNIAKQRWSSAADVLKCVIKYFEKILKAFKDIKDVKAPIADLFPELQELYSIMKPCVEIITEVQASKAPTGAVGRYMVNGLRLQLEPHVPVAILDPTTDSQRGYAWECRAWSHLQKPL